MQYILKNKDKEVLRFEVVTKTKEFESGKGFVESIRNVLIYDKILPLTINKKELSNSLKSFIENRKIPSNRQFVENVIATYSENGKELLMDYIDISLGLSLNDSYWIIPATKDYQWRDFNL
ncbi:transcriptional regulator, partial [Helicobacter sp. MIT 14-3879]